MNRVNLDDQGWKGSAGYRYRRQCTTMAGVVGRGPGRAHRPGVVARARDRPPPRFRLAEARPERPGRPPRPGARDGVQPGRRDIWCRAATTRPSSSGSSGKASRGSTAPSDRRSTGSGGPSTRWRSRRSRTRRMGTTCWPSPATVPSATAVISWSIGCWDPMIPARATWRSSSGRIRAARGWAGRGTFRPSGEGLGPRLLARRALPRVVRRRQDDPHLGRPGQGPVRVRRPRSRSDGSGSCPDRPQRGGLARGLPGRRPPGQLRRDRRWLGPALGLEERRQPARELIDTVHGTPRGERRPGGHGERDGDEPRRPVRGHRSRGWQARAVREGRPRPDLVEPGRLVGAPAHRGPGPQPGRPMAGGEPVAAQASAPLRWRAPAAPSARSP